MINDDCALSPGKKRLNSRQSPPSSRKLSSKSDITTSTAVAGGEQPRGYGRRNRYFRAARHQRHQQDRQQPLAFGIRYAAGHGPGNVAGQGKQKGNESPAAQTDAGHEPVHDKGDPRHVAHILEQRKEDMKSGQIGHNAHHGSRAAHNALQQAAQPGQVLPRRLGRPDPLCGKPPP